MNKYKPELTQLFGELEDLYDRENLIDEAHVCAGIF